MAAALALLAVLALLGLPAARPDAGACSEAGARLACRAAGLRRLPPLHDRLLAL